MTNEDWADSLSYDIYKSYEHERGRFNPNDKKELIRRYAIAIRASNKGEPKKTTKIRLNIWLAIKHWWRALLT